MARKINRPAQSAPASSDAAEELDILHPERILNFASGTITVREYGAVEWLRTRPLAADLIADIGAALQAGRAASFDSVMDICAAHEATLLRLVAQAADIDVARVVQLDPEQLEQLLLAWWGANGRFFLARALNKVAVERAVASLAASASASSTPSSSPTGTPAPMSAA
jgi:hypothetical protein